MEFAHIPRGPFNLLYQNQHFGGWPTLSNDPTAIVISFPLEDWKDSAAVVARQDIQTNTLIGRVYGTEEHERAWQQALSILSLDVDGVTWPEVGRRDPIIGALQEKYHFLRPVLFHSPYEAAASFLIGHRLRIQQARAIRNRISVIHGDAIEVEGEIFHAFPRPESLLKFTELLGLSTQKIERLHQVARAALEGKLHRTYLRQLSRDQALEELKSLPGIGPLFAQGILFRGAGVVDDLTEDDLTKYAVSKAYHLSPSVALDQLADIAQQWRPYRMWAEVLLHVWLRREIGLPKRRRPAFTNRSLDTDRAHDV